MEIINFLFIFFINKLPIFDKYNIVFINELYILFDSLSVFHKYNIVYINEPYILFDSLINEYIENQI